MVHKRTKGDLRREKLLELLKQHDELGIHEMLAQIQCSEATIRRDLELLSQAGKVIRTTGGARYDDPLRGISFHEKEQQHWKEKEAIARKARALVNNGEVIGLTGGTTTFLIARALKTIERLTIVTNAVNIAMELAENEGIQIVLTGGVMNNETFELSGPLAEEKLNNLFINKMFLGLDGIHAEMGLTTHSELEARMAQRMMSRSEKTIAVFDNSKIDRCSLFQINSLAKIEAIICNEPLSEQLTTACHRQQIAIYQTELEE